MGRAPRQDHPGDWKHIVNRGTARRTVFETEVDMRAFEALLALVVARGLIEVHAFALMTTHYHLLVRSLRGELARAMHFTDNGYARWFNRSRRRDGPLWRGRYAATGIETWEQWAATLWYIDRNPVDARMAATSIDYRYCSAFHYGRTRSGPDWLTRSTVEAYLLDLSGRRQYEPSDYLAMLPRGECVALRETLERRFERRPGSNAGPLDDLVRASPRRVQEWMEAKARLADGSMPGTLVVLPDTVDAIVADHSELAAWRAAKSHRQAVPAAGILLSGLYRLGCGMTYREIGARQQISDQAARSRVDRHSRLMRAEPSYAALAASALSDVVARDYGPVKSLFAIPRRDLLHV